MSIETLRRGDTILAEVLRGSVEVSSTTFFSPENSSFQLGVMSHATGFVEAAHYHPVLPRPESSAQQFFIVVRGSISVNFFTENGICDANVDLLPGDSIVIISGIHSIHVRENSKCITVKQGPFPGLDLDKIEVTF